MAAAHGGRSVDLMPVPLSPPRRVVIAGGGVAAVETALALRALPRGAALDLTIVAPGVHLVYRPLAVLEPFAPPRQRRYRLDEICADLDASFVRDRVDRVVPGDRVVVTEGGQAIGYDVLVIASGAKAHPALPHAHTFLAGGAAMLHWVVRDVEEGTVRQIAFVVPPGAGWTLPIYELALLTAARVRGMGITDAQTTLVTPEEVPLAIFGGAASATVARVLAETGVALRTGTYARDYDGRQLWLAPGDRTLAADVAIALPRLSGPAIDGVPSDPDGFVQVDEHGRVMGLQDVFAVGDATTFAIKQGGVAAQQADIAAALVGRALLDPRAPIPSPRPRLRAILLTGGDPLYLRATITGGESVASSASRHCPWWPPHKVAARHLAPYLADREESGLGAVHAVEA